MLKPYYQDNPNLKLAKVKTFENKDEYRVNCKKFPDGYYVKGIHLVEVNKEWVKKENVVFDNETKTYLASNIGLKNGIVGLKENGDPIFGLFKPNPYKNIVVSTPKGTYAAISIDAINHKDYLESLGTGQFFDTRGWSNGDKIAQLSKNNFANNNNHQYNIEDNGNLFKVMQNYYDNSVFPIDKDLKYVGNYIKDITFGVELETINGNLPTYILNKYGVVICKDGSLKDKNGKYPPEYVTVVFKGAKGLQALRNLAPEIAKRSEIDIRCSYHIHIGGIPIDRELMVSLYKLCLKIQNDVFTMFPYYKTNPNGYKEKNYCKKLPNLLSSYSEKLNYNDYINNNYNDLCMFLSGGYDLKGQKVNPWGGEKWNIKTRYYWINFVNPVFGKRDTLEFRLHTPTLNPDKIINWLLMCVAIIKFAQTNVKDCISTKKITFKDVLGYYSSFRGTNFGQHLSKRLIEYFDFRVDMFKKDFEKGDYISRHELITDNNFNFNVTKIS